MGGFAIHQEHDVVTSHNIIIEKWIQVCNFEKT